MRSDLQGFVLVVIIANSRKVFSLRFFSQTSRTPEIQVIICFLEVLASCSENPRVRRYHDAVHPGRKKDRECETNVSRENGLKNPERLRFEDISENAEGQNKASCNVWLAF